VSRSRNRRLQTRLGGTGVFRRRRLPLLLRGQVPLLYVLGAVLFSLLVTLPITWGVQPLPYYVGQIAPRDIASRVEFDWSIDAEEERRLLQDLAAEHQRTYIEAPAEEWTRAVAGPVWLLVERAAQPETDAGALRAYAEERQLALQAGQAAAILDGLRAAGPGLNLVFSVVDPMQETLRERIHRRGLLSAERYEQERGRFIRIRGADGVVREAYVSPSAMNGPLEPAQVRGILERTFAREMAELPEPFRGALRDILLGRITPTLVFDAATTERELEEKISQVRNQVNTINRGEVIVPRGEPVTPTRLRQLQAEDRAWRLASGWDLVLWQFLGKAVLILAIALGFVLYLCRIEPPSPERNRFAAMIAAVALALMGVAVTLIQLGWPGTFVPIGILAGVAALVLHYRAGVVAVSVFSLSCFVIFEGQPDLVGAYLASGWLFACFVPTIRQKHRILTYALLSAVAGAGIVVLWSAAMGSGAFETAQATWPLLFRVGGVFAGWIASAVVILLGLGLLERLFETTTMIRLQELQDQDQPVLRRLVIEAPGTYHHSVIVGTLAEAAAEAIGARALLAKVGSYYHDIGKLFKPEYFSENEAGMSRHDALNPVMSALIIIAHVKDGAEMALTLTLPRGIIDIIEQHHGEGLVSYFHHRAREEADNAEAVDENAYRYPGPKPRSREAALVLLADSVEAATRALERPSSAHIRRRVHEIIMSKLMDGQLEASGLTLSDLAATEDQFVRILVSMHHTRVRYPGERTEETPRRR
jgi:hypothetical protein